MHSKKLQRLIIKWTVEGFLLKICFVYNFLSLAVDNSHRRASAFEKKKTKRESEKRIRKERKKKQCNSTCKINSKSQPCPILHSDFENHRYLRRPRSSPGVPIKANVNIVLNKNKCILGEQKHVHKFQFWFYDNCLAQTLSVTTTWTCRCWPFGTATLD